MIGLNSVMPGKRGRHYAPTEVRVRVAGRVDSFEEANLIAAAVEALYTNGPAAGRGVVRSVRPIVGIESTLIPPESVRTTLELFEI